MAQHHHQQLPDNHEDGVYQAVRARFLGQRFLLTQLTTDAYMLAAPEQGYYLMTSFKPSSPPPPSIMRALDPFHPWGYVFLWNEQQFREMYNNPGSHFLHEYIVPTLTTAVAPTEYDNNNNSGIPLPIVTIQLWLHKTQELYIAPASGALHGGPHYDPRGPAPYEERALMNPATGRWAVPSMLTGEQLAAYTVPYSDEDSSITDDEHANYIGFMAALRADYQEGFEAARMGRVYGLGEQLGGLARRVMVLEGRMIGGGGGQEGEEGEDVGGRESSIGDSAFSTSSSDF